ncbi:MAG TPA: T9SS type A sorting domain-containing protein, partial [Bacteroidota bacterium]|nr:T9SS type A sorting domain-containing protein [Bacteroidota bacterium]
KEQIPNFDFDTFFDQWIYSAGHPILKMDAYSYIWDSHKYKITLNISQTQTGMKVPSTFKTPIRILFFKDSTEQTYRDLYLSQHDDTLETFISFRPDSIAIDQTYLLCQVTGTTLGVNDKGIENNNVTLFPNPVSKGNNTIIKSGISDNSNIDISIFDELGRKIKDISKDYLIYKNSNIEIPTSELKTGIYFIKISSKDNLQSKFLKLIVM